MGCGASGKEAVKEVAAPEPKADPAREHASFERQFVADVKVEVPKHWGSAAGVCIVQDTTNVQRMQELLDRTWRAKYTKDRKHADPSGKVPTGSRVLNVLRVENHELFTKYTHHKDSVRAKRKGKCAAFPTETDGFSADLDADVNEMYLFHGTNPAAADAIARNDFDMARVGSAVGTMFGPGIYLAECASKSDEYAKEGDGIFAGQFALLLCRAVAGQVNTVQEPGDTSGIVKSGFYDSICGDRMAAVGTFREMIFFSAESVYCEYIIIYSRVFDDNPKTVEPGPSTGRPSLPASGGESAEARSRRMWDDCMAGKYESVKSFVNAGNVDINLLQHGGKSMLEICAFRGELEMMQFLYSQGATGTPDALIAVVRDGMDKGRCKPNNGEAAIAFLQAAKGDFSSSNEQASNEQNINELELNHQPQVVKIINQIRLFDCLLSDEKDALANALIETHFVMGECIIKEGDVGHAFYILTKGTIVFTKNEIDISHMDAAKPEKGCFFGERSLLKTEPRAATARVTSSEAVALVLSKDQFEELLGSLSDMIEEKNSGGQRNSKVRSRRM